MLIQFACLQIFFFSNLLAFPQTQDVIDDAFGFYESEYEESNDVEKDVIYDAVGNDGVETDLEDDIFGNVVNCSTLEGFRWVLIQLQYHIQKVFKDLYSFHSCVRGSKCGAKSDNMGTAETFCEGPNMFINQRRSKSSE